MNENKLLKTEEVLNSLISELERVKTASKNLEDASSTVVTITDASDKVVKKIGTVVEVASEVLEKIEEAKIREQYDKVERELTDFSTKAELIANEIAAMKKAQTDSLTDFQEKAESLTRTLAEAQGKTSREVAEIRSEIITSNRSNQAELGYLKKLTIGLFGGLFIINVITMIIVLVR
ncbi:MAG TPA: hypothetical protein PK411_13585 [Mesotoga infera]|nr:hypothetical protein [Mesotoga infera]